MFTLILSKPGTVKRILHLEMSGQEQIVKVDRPNNLGNEMIGMST